MDLFMEKEDDRKNADEIHTSGWLGDLAIILDEPSFLSPWTKVGVNSKQQHQGQNTRN
jgi:hypothetical protein